MKKWKCTVCGYIHEGDSPPDECPACGAPRDKFIEIEAEDSTPPQSASTRRPEKTRPQMLREFIASERGHAIAVHLPNALIPVAVLFLLLGGLFPKHPFDVAAHYNMVVVLVGMPFVLVSGYIDWTAHYQGARTSPILTKIACGGIVLLVTLLTVLWWRRDAGAIRSDNVTRAAYILLHFFGLGATVLAGYLGGRLVFRSGE